MRTSPLAYFITFRTYGTWLHGDARGSFHRRPGDDSPAALPPMPRLEQAMERLLARTPVRLDIEQRGFVTEAIKDACRRDNWDLHTFVVRAEHVHVLLAPPPGLPPERVMTALKARATWWMVKHGAHPRGSRMWSRHGSTRYVWTPRELDAVRRYIDEHVTGG